jgi:hypothetical protein
MHFGHSTRIIVTTSYGRSGPIGILSSDLTSSTYASCPGHRDPTPIAQAESTPELDPFSSDDIPFQQLMAPHIIPRPECSCSRRFGLPRQGRHNKTCAISISRARGRAELLFRNPDNTRALPDGPVPAPRLDLNPPTEEPQLAVTDLPSLADIAAVQLTIIDRIPIDCRVPWAEVLRRVLTCLNHDTDATRWHRFFMVARVVLHRPHSSEGDMSNIIASRCRRFVAHNYRNVPLMWAETLASVRNSTQHLSNVSYEVEPLRPSWNSFPPEPETPVPLASISRATALTRRTFFSRALQAFEYSKVAPNTAQVADALQLLHPAGVAVIVPAPVGPPAHFKALDILAVLHHFHLGSSAGISLLSPAHIRDACATPGSVIPDALSDVLHLLERQHVPPDVIALLFGARLVGLEKPGSIPTALCLRPIAVGETIRRMLGNLHCRALSGDIRNLLSNFHQFGVAVPAAADAISSAARRFALSMPSSYAIVKLDFRNAYNCVFRQVFVDRVTQHFPVLLPYVRLAYGNPSRLQFNTTALSSSRGVQQGDPLSPLLFSLVLLHLIEATFAVTPIRPELHAWFLDDAILGGPIDELNTFIEKMIPIAASLGLTLNDRKCEVISDPDASFIPPLANFGQKLPRTRWTILGCPCGSFEFAEEFCKKTQFGYNLRRS